MGDVHLANGMNMNTVEQKYSMLLRELYYQRNKLGLKTNLDCLSSKKTLGLPTCFTRKEPVKTVQSVRRKYSQVPISDMAKGDVGQGGSSQRVETVAMDKIVKGVLPKSRIRACTRTSSPTPHSRVVGSHSVC